MKKGNTFFAAFILVASAFLPQQVSAQSPNKMSYQAVIRNASSALVTNQTVGMQVSILQGSASGPAVYVETQTPTSNANALVSMEIGSGTVVSGNFSTIDWANGPYFIKTETDPTGGTTYSITGTSEAMSVPYAFYAKTAETVVNNDDADPDPLNEIELPNGGSNTQVLSTDGAGNYSWVNNADADADSSNEIELPVGGSNAQVLSTDGAGSYSWVDQTALNVPNGTAAGQTARWNGSAWVVDGTLYNDGNNIGIGTTSPQGSLHVNGANGGASWTYFQGNATGAINPSSSINSGLMLAWNTSGSAGESEIIFGNGLGGDPKLHFGTWNGITKSHLITVEDNGDVGIGTTNPHALLQLGNTIGNRKIVIYEGVNNDHQFYGFGINVNTLRYQVDAISSNHVFYAGTSAASSTELMRIQGNGRVGIGTSAPVSTLSVGTSSGTSVLQTNVALISSNNIEALGIQGSSAGTNLNFYKNGSATRQGAIGVYTDALGSSFQFYTTSTTGTPDQNRMTIHADGNVGVGTVNPQVKLHVNAVMRLEPIASAPATAAKGDMYFNGTTNKLMVFDGSIWQACW